MIITLKRSKLKQDFKELFTRNGKMEEHKATIEFEPNTTVTQTKKYTDPTAITGRERNRQVAQRKKYRKSERSNRKRPNSTGRNHSQKT